MHQPNKTVEYQLVASEFDWQIASGKTIKAWGFNKQLPAPVLKAAKGDTMVIKVKNNLPEPTIIHWHGIRLEADMDGTDVVQKTIQPGEEFEYRFVVPDAGTFWCSGDFIESLIEKSAVSFQPKGKHSFKNVNEEKEMAEIVNPHASSLTIDPVCRMLILDKSLAIQHPKNIELFFCSQACLHNFKIDQAATPDKSV